MAAAVLLNNKVVCYTPFLIREVSVTNGTDGLAVTHGEDRAPDMITVYNGTANPTASEVSVVKTSATVVTIDCEAAAGTTYVYLIWFSQASGGISA